MASVARLILRKLFLAFTAAFEITSRVSRVKSEVRRLVVRGMMAGCEAVGAGDNLLPGPGLDGGNAGRTFRRRTRHGVIDFHGENTGP